MTLEQYLKIMLKHWRLVVTCFVLVGAGAYVGSRLMTPLYQSTAIVEIVIRTGTNVDYNSLLASDQLVQTEATLAASDPVLREVASHYPGLSVEQLSREVTATSVVSTQLFNINVQDPSPTRAAALANDIAMTLINQQNQLLQQNIANAGSFLFIAQSAQPPPNPASPNKPLYTGAGLLTGLLLGMLLALLFELLDKRVRSPEALTQLLDWPVLAAIWRAAPKEHVINPMGREANIESYRILRTNIGFSGIDKPLHTLMVTSAIPRDGKTTITANLAIFMARAGKTTLLIDADLRRPAMHDLFGLPADRMGLSNAVLAFSMPNIPETPPLASGMTHMSGTPVKPNMPDTNGGHRLHPATLQQADAIAATSLSLEPYAHSVGIPNLWVMPSGPLPPNPPELLDSKAMQRLLAVIANYGFEVVIFDTAPLLGLSDTSILASKMDGTLVVADITRADKKNLKQMKAVLMQTGAHVLGCVVNKQRRSRHDATYYSYSYYQSDEQNGEKKHNKGKKDAPAVSTVPINAFSQPEMQNGAGDHSPQDVSFPGSTTDEAGPPTEKLGTTAHKSQTFLEGGQAT